MTILVADDHEINRKLLNSLLVAQGYHVRQANDGGEAFAILQKASGPMVALLDWQMPIKSGIDICREVRKEPNASLLFLIIVTVRNSPADIVAGLKAGANDYVTKPFDREELLARVRIGSDMVQLQQSLVQRVQELEDAMTQIKQLKGLLPICSYCKKIRDDNNYWQQVENYISTHAEVQFSHGYCPDCYVKHLRPQFESQGFPAPSVEDIFPPKDPHKP